MVLKFFLKCMVLKLVPTLTAIFQQLPTFCVVLKLVAIERSNIAIAELQISSAYCDLACCLFVCVCVFSFGFWFDLVLCLCVCLLLLLFGAIVSSLTLRLNS